MSATFELKFPSRCLSAHYDDSSHGFLVSTANLRGPNEVREIRLLRYNEDSDDISCVAMWAHNYEINSLAASPTDKSIVATVYSTLDGRGGRATIWSLPELPLHPDTETDLVVNGSGEPVTQGLVRVVDVPGVPSAASPQSADPMHHFQWAPNVPEHKAGTFITAHSSGVRSWVLQEGGGVEEVGAARFDHEVSVVGGVAWDPHHPAEAAVATDGEVSMWDLRSGDMSRKISEAVSVSSGVVRGLSYNTNKPWHLATCGDDFRVKLWDLRRCAAPVKILDGHTYWATCVAFNPYHDQIIVSGGADSRVNLWRIPSVSSAPLLELDEGDASLDGDSTEGTSKMTEPRLAADQAVRVHTDHCDSVTGLAWSVKNAWVYASLSYSGRVAISTVPSAEKYRVLL